MTRKELTQHIENNFESTSNFPWLRYPTFQVFRHKSNKKWFALFMTVPKDKLGLEGKEPLDIVNFKCDKTVICSLWGETGIFPAYHMSKGTWLSVALDGSATDEHILFLLSLSYELTAPKIKSYRNFQQDVCY